MAKPLKPAAQDYERFYPANRAAWRQWLADNHDKSPGVWVILYKSRSGQPTITYDELVEEALCYGWIDSSTRKLDDERHIQMVTPRKPRSGWSRSNKDRVQRLMAQNLMTSAGLAKIDAAKVDGSWNALDDVETLTMPEDFREALAANPEAQRYFEAFPPGSKKIILQWIASARKPETRAKRIAEAVRFAAQNIRANHYRQ